MTFADDEDLTRRFWTKVDKTAGCWIWTAARNPYRGDYGIFWVRYPDRPKGVTLLAHRVSWEITNRRPVPDGLLVLHTCDNPPCVRPEHLFLGSDLDNSVDKISKGRLVVPNRKFTEEEVRTLRASRDAGASIASLARRCGVKPQTMRKILIGETYASVR